MRNFLAILIVLLVYATSLFLLFVTAPEMIHIAVIAEIFLNFVLHFVWCAKNKISLATLPSAWALCIIPLYMFAFHFPWVDDFPIPDSYIFMLFGGVTVLPILIISSLTSAFSYYMRWRSM